MVTKIIHQVNLKVLKAGAEPLSPVAGPGAAEAGAGKKGE